MKQTALRKGAGAFRDNYLAAAIIALSLFCSLGAGAQVYSNTQYPNYGVNFKRINSDSTLHLPTFCGVPSLHSNLTSKAAVAFDSCNHKLYFYDPKTAVWDTIVGGSGLSNYDSAFVRGTVVNDSTLRLFRKNGDVVNFTILGKANAAGGLTSLSATYPVTSTGGSNPVVGVDTTGASTGVATKGDVRKKADSLGVLIAGKQNLVTLTTTGSSGAATFNQSTGALNIPNYAGSGGSGTSIYYNILDYGADSTGVSSSTTAINNAIAAASVTGGVVFIPHGTYKTTDTIKIRHGNVVLLGEGESSKILATGNFGNIIDAQPLSTPANAYSAMNGVGFKNFYIESAVQMTSGSGIFTNYTNNVIIENMRIGTADFSGTNPAGSNYVYDCISMKNQMFFVMSGTQVNPYRYGLYVSGAAHADIGSGFSFDGLVTGNCNFLGKRNGGTFLTGSAGVYIAGGNGGFQIEQSNISFFENGIKAVGNNRELFIGHAFSADDCGGAGIYIKDTLNILQITGGWSAGNGRGAQTPNYNIYLDSNTIATNLVDGTKPKVNITGGSFYAGNNGIYLGTGNVTITGAHIYANSNNQLVLGPNVVAASITGGRVSALSNLSAITPIVRGVTGLTDQGGVTTYTQGSVLFGSSTGTITESNSNLFYDQTNTRLGIGTAIPSGILHLKHSGSSLAGLIESTTASATTEWATKNSGAYVNNWGITGSSYSGSLATNTGYAYNTTPYGLMLYLNSSTSSFRVATGGLTERFRIDSAGNVGIGVTPTEKLHVAGNINLTGSLKVNGAAGTAGQVLQKDGSNNLVWAAPSASSGNWTLTGSDISNDNTGIVKIGTAAGTTGKLSVGGNVEIMAGNDLMLRPPANDYDMRIRALGSSTSSYMGFMSGGDLTNPRMVILASTGRVGIGTATPQAMLDIQSKFRVNISQGATGELPAGTTIDTYSGENLIFMASPAAPSTKSITFAAYDGSAATWRSIIEWGNVTSGTPSLLLAKTTGKVGVGVSSPTSTLHTTSLATAYTATATGITLGATHNVIEVTATGQTITLPTAVGITGRIYTIKLTASGTATVATTSSQTIDGSTTYSLSAQYKYVTVQSTGSNWIIIANN